MDKWIIIFSVILPALMLLKTNKTFRQAFIVLISAVMLYTVVGVVLFFHYLYATELLMSLVIGLIFLTILFTWDQAHKIPYQKTVEEINNMLYNLVIIYVLSIGGLIISYRLFYQIEFIHPLVLPVIFIGTLWVFRYLLYRKNYQYFYTNFPVKLMVVLFMVTFLLTLTTTKSTNQEFIINRPSVAEYHDVDFYETDIIKETFIPYSEGFYYHDVSDMLIDDDTIYLAITFNSWDNNQQKLFRFDRETGELEASIDVEGVSQFIGKYEEDIVYFNRDERTIDIINDGKLFDIQGYIEDSRIENDTVTIITRYFEDEIIYNKYEYHLKENSLTTSYDWAYDDTVELLDDNQNVISEIDKNTIYYNDGHTIYFKYARLSNDLYRYQDGTVKLFTSDIDFRDIFLQNQKVISEKDRNLYFYNDDGEKTGYTYLPNAAYRAYDLQISYDIFDSQTFRYISIVSVRTPWSHGISIRLNELNKPALPLFLPYYITPLSGGLLILGVLPLKKRQKKITR